MTNKVTIDYKCDRCKAKTQTFPEGWNAQHYPQFPPGWNSFYIGGENKLLCTRCVAKLTLWVTQSS